MKTNTRGVRDARPIPLAHRGMTVARAGALLALLASTGCLSPGEGWVTTDYQPGASDPPPATGNVQGLTVLVSFADHTVSDTQAAKLYRAINETGYTDDGNSGSVKDYFLDMSNGQLTVESRVVRVQVPGFRADYDTADEDELYAPPGIESIDQVTMSGPSMHLLNAVLCKLRTCDGNPPDYQEVTAAGVSAPVHVDLDFSTLSTRRLAFWPDNYTRDFIGNSQLTTYRRQIDVPNIEIYEYVSLLYAGNTTRDHGQGLWPRSVPSIGTEVPGNDSSVRLGRFQIQGTLTDSSNPDETFIGTLIHETAHTLFDLPDLYDGGHELGLADGHPASNGIGRHGLMGHTANEKKPAILSAPLKARLGWANVVDISDFAEGSTVVLDTNGGQVARYCRQDSTYDECYYIEARSASHPRGPSGFTPDTPDEGLVVWHSENSRNVVDFVVNNHAEGTANLHYEVALVQADGLRELEGPKGTANQSNDYFKAGYADRFDATTVPSSHWWDGTESGLAIRNISVVGSTMSFEIGERPASRIHVDTDAHVQVDIGAPTVRVGEVRQVTFTPDPGYAYDVVGRGYYPFSASWLTGQQVFHITGSVRDNYIRVVSYPENGQPPAPSADRKLRISLAGGVQVMAYGESARIYQPRLRTIDVFHDFAKFLPGLGTSEQGRWNDRDFDLLFRTYSGRDHVRLFAKAEPGFVLKSIDSYGMNFAGSSLNDVAYRSTAGVDVTVPSNLSQEYAAIALVNAEQIPGYFCREGAVEEWRPDRIYRGVGDKVRYGDYIYSSNVPRAFLRENVDSGTFEPVPTPGKNPENSPEYWTRFASCKPYTEDCSGLPEWSLGGDALPANPDTAVWANSDIESFDHAVFNGAVYELITNERHEVPGAFEHRQLSSGAAAFAGMDRDIPIYSNQSLIDDRRAAWKLIGNCSTPANWQRATIVPSRGVTSVEPSGVTYVQHDPTEPVFVTGITSGWSFDFDLAPGYVLDDVYVDGVAMGLAPSARSLAVPLIPNARPPYIEVKATCTGSACGAAAPPQVTCELGQAQHWGNGFVYSNVKVTNVSGAPITGWQVLLEFADPPDLWGSSGIDYQVNGNQVIASNMYEWNGNLGIGASYQFSVGGNLTGPFVPPTCTGL